MSNRNWFKKRVQDSFLHKAHREGFRSRAAYKLLEVLDKYALVRTGDRVLDIGAAPGSWMQVLRDKVGPKGLVVGVDLLDISPIEEAVFFQGDIRDAVIQGKVQELAKNGFHGIFSDMAPNTSGIHHADCGHSVELVGMVLDSLPIWLKKGGSCIAKVFEGEEFKSLHSRFCQCFDLGKSFKPKASLAESREIYLVGKGYLGKPTKAS
jgi:23S rRNA (uridine2552-2'-O)-methyltransferase